MKRSRLFKLLLALLLLIGVPLGLWRLYLAHVINRQLAAIRASGLPTNGQELNRWYTAVPDPQNAALVLTQAFALRRTYPDNRSDLIVNFKLPKRGEPLSPESAALLEGYVALNEAALSKAGEAVHRPACRYPMDCSQLMNTPLPHLTWLKNLVELHQYAAFLSMRAGAPFSASSNIVAMLELARTLDKEPCLISQFVRLRLLKMAFETLERRANAGPLAPADTAPLTLAFQETSTTFAVRALIGERAMTLPYFRMTRAEAATLYHPKDPNAASNSPLPCHGPAILRLIGYYDLDYGAYLIGMKNAIERLHELPPENLRAGAYLARVGEASVKHRRTLSGLVLSGYASTARRENEGTAMQHLALTALAIERFAGANGHFPNQLADLADKLLSSEALEDPFSGFALIYRPTEHGYILYSVGPDRQDNGGLEPSRKNESDDKASYDITFIVER
jgi:hypothetical protein